jgi:hypothetical protein
MKYMQFYREHQDINQGISYNAFVSRVNCGRDPFEAIQTPANKYKTKRIYEPKREIKQPARTVIDIKYSREEAIVFASAYEDLIKDLQAKYDECEEPQEANEILEKKRQVEKEYEIFLDHNI